MTENEQEMEHQRETLAGKSGTAATPGHHGGPLPDSTAPLPDPDADPAGADKVASGHPDKIEPRAGRDS